jgi:hypothetical protein
MGRAYQAIRNNGRSFWALFDSGSTRTYITEGAARAFKSHPVPNPFKVGLGGKTRTIARFVVLSGELERNKFHTFAYVTSPLGNDEDGRPIDVLFGAISMEEWYVRVDPKARKVDLSNFTREFTEF